LGGPPQDKLGIADKERGNFFFGSKGHIDGNVDPCNNARFVKVLAYGVAFKVARKGLRMAEQAVVVGDHGGGCAAYHHSLGAAGKPGKLMRVDHAHDYFEFRAGIGRVDFNGRSPAGHAHTANGRIAGIVADHGAAVQVGGQYAVKLGLIRWFVQTTANDNGYPAVIKLGKGGKYTFKQRRQQIPDGNGARFVWYGYGHGCRLRQRRERRMPQGRIQCCFKSLKRSFQRQNSNGFNDICRTGIGYCKRELLMPVFY